MKITTNHHRANQPAVVVVTGEMRFARARARPSIRSDFRVTSRGREINLHIIVPLRTHSLYNIPKFSFCFSLIRLISKITSTGPKKPRGNDDDSDFNHRERFIDNETLPQNDRLLITSLDISVLRSSFYFDEELSLFECNLALFYRYIYASHI